MESCFFWGLCNRLRSRRWLCNSQNCCLKCLDDIIRFGIFIVTRHGKQLHQPGAMTVNIAKLHKLFEYSGLQCLHCKLV